MFDLSGRTALVTGAGRGVGAGIARLLAAKGASVAVNDLSDERARETVEQITRAGGRALAAPFDVTGHIEVRTGVERVERELGPVDILVNNAGVPSGMTMRSFSESQPQDWRPYVDLNLYGVLNCCHATINGMVKRGFGRIITISSGAATVGLSIGVAPYAAGKGGAIAFMRHLALENAMHGVTANTIAIGFIHNPMDPITTARYTALIPTGRAGEPEDIGALCVYLASNESRWMTAQTLQINGGAVTT